MGLKPIEVDLVPLMLTPALALPAAFQPRGLHLQPLGLHLHQLGLHLRLLEPHLRPELQQAEPARV